MTMIFYDIQYNVVCTLDTHILMQACTHRHPHPPTHSYAHTYTSSYMYYPHFYITTHTSSLLYVECEEATTQVVPLVEGTSALSAQLHGLQCTLVLIYGLARSMQWGRWGMPLSDGIRIYPSWTLDHKIPYHTLGNFELASVRCTISVKHCCVRLSP